MAEFMDMSRIERGAGCRWQWRLVFRIVVAVMILSAVSCAPAYRAHFDLTASGQIVWPGEPEKPRIKYLWVLQNVGSGEGGRRTAMDVITGKTMDDITDPQTSSILLRPQGFYADESRYYIADPGAVRVTVIDRKSGELFHIKTVDGESLEYPRSVVADREGNIYVVDSDLARVISYDRRGKFRFFFSGGFRRPTGIAIDRQRDRIYVVDTNAHTVYIYDTGGVRRGSMGHRGSGKGEFNYPTHAFVDRNGDLYVTDFLNFRVQIFSPEGEFVASIGSLGDSYDTLDKPKGVAVDSGGHIYIVDGAHDMVKIFDRRGRLLLFFGSTGHELGEFYMPTGLFIDEKDIIYVMDTINMRVQAFQFLGGD